MQVKVEASRIWPAFVRYAAWGNYTKLGGLVVRQGGNVMAHISRPGAVSGGWGFAHYNYAWSRIGVRISTKRVALGALKALYGSRAANAAIREAQRVSGKDR